MAHPSDRTDCRAIAPSPPFRKGFVFLAPLAALAVLALLPAPAAAQEPPDAARIGAALAPELPAWWSVASVEVRTSVNDGDAVEPRWRQHFQADAAPRETLYVSSGTTMGPFEVAIPTRAPTETYRLYGTARSRLKLGDWVTKVALDNAVDGLGQPLSLFPRPVVAVGSPAAEQASARLAIARELTGTVAEAAARTAADVDALHQSAETAAAALDAVSLQRLEALRAGHEEERAALAAAGRRERAALEKEYQARLDLLQSDLAAMTVEIAEMPAATEVERSDLIAANRERLEALRAGHEEERAALAAAGGRERAALEKEHQARLEALNADLTETTAGIAAMPAAAETEHADLAVEIRTRLDALKSHHQAALAQIAAVGESERAAAKEEAYARLEALKARLAEESSAAEARLAATEAERTRLVAEHQEGLAALTARNETARAAAEATPETLLALSKAEAGVAARRTLIAVFQTQIEEGKRVAKSAAEASAADLQTRTAWYDALLKGLGSDVVAERQAALDLALASDAEGLRAMTLVLARVSDDTALAARAVDTTLASEDAALRAMGIELGLASEDGELRLKAFDAALSSGDREVKAEVIGQVLASDDRALKAKAVDWALAPDNAWFAARRARTSQWANRVVDFSRQDGGKQAAEAALGPPQVNSEDRCKRGLPSWYAGGIDGGEHYIRVAFAKPVLWPEVVVHETGNGSDSAGFVRKLILWDADGNGVEYPVQDELRRCPGTSTFDLRRHRAPVAEVTVVIDLDHSKGGSEGIDAIRLVGTPLK